MKRTPSELIKEMAIEDKAENLDSYFSGYRQAESLKGAKIDAILNDLEEVKVWIYEEIERMWRDTHKPQLGKTGCLKRIDGVVQKYSHKE